MLLFLRQIKFGFIFLTLFFFLLLVLSIAWIYPKNELNYGVTFSPGQATDLGLDWKEVYTSALNDLHIKKFRLAAYWDEIEKVPGEFNWEDLDWQINQAKQNNADIILAVGSRLPRWPECHIPNWVDWNNQQEREDKTSAYIRAVIERYKNYNNIFAWQVENEPFLVNFGDCPEFDKDFLDKEIALVRSLDTRDIIITDSGELSLWVPAAKRADIFGTTMYRDTYSQLLRSYIHYPIDPGFFRFKKNITKIFTSPKKMIVIELQAEPWGPVPFQELSIEDRNITMSLDKFQDIINFSRLTSFNEFYLWGIEWWYFEKTKEGRPEFWNFAQTLFN